MAGKSDENTPGYVRRSVSLPAELEQRIRDCSEANRVNWSNVAARAFERELEFHEAMSKGAKNMKATIERLKRGKADAESKDRAEGVTRGKEWATDDAEYEDLVGIASLPGDWVEADSTESSALESDIADKLSLELEDFRRTALGVNEDHEPTKAMLVGFYQGAVSVWNEVKDSL
jgi:hypothetical protein